MLWSVDITDCPMRWGLPVKLAAAEYSVTHCMVRWMWIMYRRKPSAKMVSRIQRSY